MVEHMRSPASVAYIIGSVVVFLALSAYLVKSPSAHPEVSLLDAKKAVDFTSLTLDLPPIRSEGAEWPEKVEYFNPYVGPDPVNAPTAYAFSVTPQCDQSINMLNIRRILKLKEFWKTAAFQTAAYQEHSWIGAQVGFFVGQADVVAIVPPCFFPSLSESELAALNSAIYGKGMPLLIVGGLQGSDFIAKYLQGTDGVGYVDGGGSGSIDAGGGMGRDGGGAWGENFSPRLVRDATFSDGPFYLQEAAVNTMFFYGPKMLESAETVVGIPAEDLPANTKHYYMSADEISVVFEIPAGNGRIIFIGYDYISLASRWIDVLLLAQRELQGTTIKTTLPSTLAKVDALHKADHKRSTTELCPASSYCPNPKGAPVPCPMHTSSPRGSSSMLACKPLAGYFGPAGRKGILCPSDSYCPKHSAKPLRCPANTRSIEGSTSQVECRASAGYHHDGGGFGTTPILCPEDSFCPAGSSLPRHCPANSISPAGSTSISDCKTIAG